MNNIIIKSKTFPRPLWFMRQAGRYLPEYRALRQQSDGFMDMCLSPQKAAEITLQPLRRFPDIDAAILFADILIIPYALGVDLQFVEKQGPLLTGFDINQPLKVDETFHHKIAPILQTIQGVKPELTHQTFIGFAGAPWTVAAYMLQGQGGKEMASAKAIAYENLAAMDQLIQTLTEATTSYLLAQIKAGVDMVQIFESWAGVLPLTYFKKWCIKPTLKIIKALKHHYPEISIMVFPRGASSQAPLYFQGDVAPDGISIDTQADIAFLVENLPPQAVLQGGLDPQLVKAGGDAMYAETDRILSLTKDRPYIFNLGHGMTPDIPVAHVDSLIKYVKGWGR